MKKAEHGWILFGKEKPFTPVVNKSPLWVWGMTANPLRKGCSPMARTVPSLPIRVSAPFPPFEAPGGGGFWRGTRPRGSRVTPPPWGRGRGLGVTRNKS